MQPLSKSAVAIKLGQASTASAAGRSGGRGCPHTAPKASSAAGRRRPGSASPRGQALMSVAPCVAKGSFLCCMCCVALESNAPCYP